MKRICIASILMLLAAGISGAPAANPAAAPALASTPPAPAASAPTESPQWDTARCVVFRFLPQDDTFYLSVHENAAELERLQRAVGSYRQAIVSGAMPLYVRGYSSALPSQADNLASARIRANRVKSELIRREGLREADFVTSLRSEPFGGQRSAVTVTLWLPAADTAGAAPRRFIREDPPAPAEGRRFIQEDPLPPLPPETSGEGTFPPSAPIEENGSEAGGFGIGAGSPQADGESGGYGISAIVPRDYKFAVRANLLHWATLTPDAGFEWRMGRSFSLLAHGTWTRWRWDDNNRRFHLWRVAPEFRWYLGLRKRWHLGVEYHTGGFDFQFGATGHRGTFNGASAVGGYQFELGKHLSLDVTLGFGGTGSHYHDYRMQQGTRVRSEDKKDTYIGINQAAVTLGWRFGTGRR